MTEYHKVYHSPFPNNSVCPIIRKYNHIQHHTVIPCSALYIGELEVNVEDDSVLSRLSLVLLQAESDVPPGL